jgi:2-oxoisovalerate dehydrogenase E1 component
VILPQILTEQRLLALFCEGKLYGTVHTCIGQEFVGPSVVAWLRESDTVFSNHRCHGHFIAYCDQVEGLLAEIMGKVSGVCAGLGGSQHLHYGRFFSNGIQGGIVPVAAGMAMAHKLDADGGIAVVFIGDGTLGQGVVYETLNLASKWELPLLVVLENNHYAQSTHQGKTLAGGIEERFASFGIETARSSTWQWHSLVEEMGASVAKVRSTGKPLFHRVDTYRLMAHSKGDDNRPSETVEPYVRCDPLNLLLQRHARHPWLEHLLEGIENRLDLAVAAADAAPFGPPPKGAAPATPPSWAPLTFNKERGLAAVRLGLDTALRENPKALLIGEDVESPYGGAFKASLGLSDSHPGRVLNTPISEHALVGLGNGLALGGYHPMVEIMFGDFLTLATDQWVNHAAKFAGMYGGQVKTPLLIRTPMGGKRGYGPTHSQSLERLFLAQPGTRVLALHHRYNPERVYAMALAAGEPTLLVENKILYGAMANPEPLPGYRLLTSPGPFPWVRMKPESRPDLTLVAIGGMSVEAEQAVQLLFEEHEVLVDLFLPLQLYPLDASCLHDSLAQTRRLLVVEEGQGFASVGSEIIAQAAEAQNLLAVGRVFAEASIIPSARPLEGQCLPDCARIVSRALELSLG